MAFRTLRIDELDPIEVAGVRWHPVRHALGVRGFGVNAYSASAGEDVVEDHTEADDAGDGHQEMYVVLTGHARFEVDGEAIDAPAGTVVFLPEPTSRRHAVAEADGTTVLALGAEPGVPYDVSAWEWRFRAQPHIDAEEWEQGVALMHEGLAARPGDASLLYNLACFETHLGRLDDATAHLEEALAAEPDNVREWAEGDRDLDALRERADYPL
ncbi:MAG TPA: tetratricopeptide repeat protein [Solirubrobacteraceae bacterium]|nr:tetratricopeptide repeat protein [Solirubrobacteraceae bacterium]